MKVLEAGIAYTDARGLSEPRDSVASLGVQYLVYLGQLEQALSLAEEFVPQFQAGDRQLNLSDVRDAQTLALLLRGEPDQTLDWLDWLVACSRDIGQPRAGLGRAACAHAAHGNDDVAVEMFTEMVTEPGGSMGDLPPQVRCLINLDRLDIAEDLVANEPSTIPASRHGRVAALAALTEAKGDYRKAVAGYAEAAERWHDFTMYVEEAFALLGQGRCLIKLNRPEEAVPVLTTAREMFAKMGARPALAETESLLAL
jgi:tetratricopeptide (TPR) repeat protein